MLSNGKVVKRSIFGLNHSERPLDILCQVLLKLIVINIVFVKRLEKARIQNLIHVYPKDELEIKDNSVHMCFVFKYIIEIGCQRQTNDPTLLQNGLFQLLHRQQNISFTYGFGISQ
jgi:hypothetical protein